MNFLAIPESSISSHLNALLKRAPLIGMQRLQRLKSGDTPFRRITKLNKAISAFDLYLRKRQAKPDKNIANFSLNVDFAKLLGYPVLGFISGYKEDIAAQPINYEAELPPNAQIVRIGRDLKHYCLSMGRVVDDLMNDDGTVNRSSAFYEKYESTKEPMRRLLDSTHEVSAAYLRFLSKTIDAHSERASGIFKNPSLLSLTRSVNQSYGEGISWIYSERVPGRSQILYVAELKPDQAGLNFRGYYQHLGAIEAHLSLQNSFAIAGLEEMREKKLWEMIGIVESFFSSPEQFL
ncbi:MAG: hypothetical protein SFT81_07220 [Candidatus Caenarcaniphilales bacterium]|nr:hypothetical protein [Candidatus Caenarcaniphilales bacterium]